MENGKILITDFQDLAEQEPTSDLSFHLLRPELHVGQGSDSEANFEEKYITVSTLMRKPER